MVALHRAGYTESLEFNPSDLNSDKKKKTRSRQIIWFNPPFSETREGRPATTISRPSHILLILLSEPPQNPSPSNIFFKCLILQDKTIF